MRAKNSTGSILHNFWRRPLVLTRKLGETIVIDDEVRVTVLEVKGDRVRLMSMPRPPSWWSATKSTSVATVSRRQNRLPN
jgi:hypothetical protein